MILSAFAYTVRVLWSSTWLPMACSSTTTLCRRLSTPHEASAPIMVLSCVVTKPLWLSPRPWYHPWAHSVEAMVIPMYLPVYIHPGTHYPKAITCRAPSLISFRSPFKIFLDLLQISCSNKRKENCTVFMLLDRIYSSNVSRPEERCHTALTGALI